jgi:tetratricopeptide (TPR) repeat protein
VTGRSNSNLLSELRWYQEDFLDYPFHPETDHADKVVDALQQWGLLAFSALFGSMHGRDWFKDATRNGHEQLRLIISSDDPRILGWPWEALRDPETDVLALGCQIERKLNQNADPLPLSATLPEDKVNILLVTARPFEADVGYRSISRPLIDLIENQQLPASVTLLRPPTFDQLLEHLREHPDNYHILHFDGHGGYGDAHNSSDQHRLKGLMGQLVFETADGKPDYVTAEKLGCLLREHRIPAVVLNACQSAMVDGRAVDPFASVAAALLKAGVRSVVAMAYSLYVSGAQQFLPAFYRRLFEQGSVTEAVRSGRQQMFRNQGRVCARGSYNLQDWLVPVIYQQDTLDFRFATAAVPLPSSDVNSLPEEADDRNNAYGFIGRDKVLLSLERAMRRPPAGILIHGLGGSGKTTLVRGFIRWRVQTRGLEQGRFWFSFSEIRSAEYIFNRIGESLFGDNFITISLQQKVDVLTQILCEHPFLIVWDNFESARGIDGSAVAGLLSEDDQQLLKRFLEKLRGGKTKILITSRGEEEWLGSSNRCKLHIGGLYGEERWEFCQIILNDLGKIINRDDPELVKLMNALDGHPLMMRMVVPQLADYTATDLLVALNKNLEALGLSGNESWDKLQATVRFATQLLPEDLQPLLLPLSLHDHFVTAYALELIAKEIDSAWDRKKVVKFLRIMVSAGLVSAVGDGVFEIHPAFKVFIHTWNSQLTNELYILWSLAFIEQFGQLADMIAHMPFHDQLAYIKLFEASFYSARNLAELFKNDLCVNAINQLLAIYSINISNYSVAKELYQRILYHSQQCGLAMQESSACHQLGIIAHRQVDFPSAEIWYKKSVSITERLEQYDMAAKTYHQLGKNSFSQQDLDNAEYWYNKALKIKINKPNSESIAMTYHELGVIAYNRGDFAVAEDYLTKAVKIFSNLDIKNELARTYNELGNIAFMQNISDAAEKWYQKCLDISEDIGDELQMASVYAHLGNCALHREDYNGSSSYYHKALSIFENHRDDLNAARAYMSLGDINMKQKLFEPAELWYSKALKVMNNLNDVYYSTIIYKELSVIAGLQGHFENSVKWAIKCYNSYVKQNKDEEGQHILNALKILYNSVEPEKQKILNYMCAEAGICGGFK